jgi:hypothetical protein
MTDEQSVSASVSRLEENCIQYLKRIESLESHIKSRNQKIKKLNMMVEMERFKSNLFAHIITACTDIKISDIYEETTEGIHVYNYDNGNVPIIVHDYLETKEYNIMNKKKNPGKTFRAVNHIELVDEKPQEQEEKLKKVEEQMDEIVQENKFDVPVKETLNKIEEMFNEISTNRVIKKNLLAIKDYRVKLLGRLNLPDYVKLVSTHIKRLENIFSKKKSHDHKKTVPYISSSLSSLEQRLVFYGQYYNTSLDTDDIQRFKIALQVNMDHPTRYVPFLFSELSIKLHNYSVAICSISEILTRVLVNPTNTFNNVVYLSVEKSTKEDPYSFYILESIGSDGKRCWKLECRLDEFSKSVTQDLKTYCINLFRKIYFSIFDDNLYREDYTEKAQIAGQDCIQLLENIIFLSKQKSFCNTVRNLIVKNCTIQPSKLDKFNFTADDKVIKRSFAQENDDPADIQDSIKRIFDNIDKEDIDKVVSNFNE